MIFQRFYDDKLAQASYLVGCSATGQAVVIDPNRDVEQYVRAADSHGLAITHVTETHIHADFVSGARELRDRTGATLYLSDEGDADWKYAFAGGDEATLVRDGDTLSVGNVTLRVLHTPGHTPEHVSFLVTDTAATQEPMGLFSGDFVFVGDVGRPDLLEKAAKVSGTMEASARRLYQSLQRLADFPDHLQIWPGHGAGSACGKALGAVPQSTLGYERAVNWAFATDTEDEFVQEVLAGQPEPPKYFAEMKRINKEGPRILGGLPRPTRLPENRLADLIQRAEIVVDTRRWEDYSNGHVPGTINIPLNQSFTTWAGWLLPYDRPIYLIADEEHGSGALDEAVRDLAMIGLDNVGGHFDIRAVDDWRGGDPEELATVKEITVAELVPLLGSDDVAVLDVRGNAEWEAGHIHGVPNIPLGYLPDRLSEVPTAKTVVLHCHSGARSAIAASVLQRHGVQNVVNLKGGFMHWMASGQPVERAVPSTV